ncbi:ribonuclease H-like domain-containing protein [Tanacetum coccineum]
MKNKSTNIIADAYYPIFLSKKEPKNVIQALKDPSWVEVFRNKKDERGIIVRNKARLVVQGYTQEEGIDYDEVFAPVARRSIQRSYIHKKDGIFISQDKYVAKILKKFDFATVKTTSTPMEPNKALVKDEEADNVDVHLYRSMIGSLMYLTASRPDIMFAVCACARRVRSAAPLLETGRDTKIPQSSGPPEKVDDEAVHKELGDRMKRAATTASSLEVDTLEDREVEITATIDGQLKTITEVSLRRHLKLEDADGRTSADPEILLDQEEPTELVEDLGSSKKGEKEINTANISVMIQLVLKISYTSNRSFFVAEVRKNMCMHLKNQEEYKQRFLRLKGSNEDKKPAKEEKEKKNDDSQQQARSSKNRSREDSDEDNAKKKKPRDESDSKTYWKLIFNMMIEKKYPLTQEMLSRILSRRLEDDHESEMAYELLSYQADEENPTNFALMAYTSSGSYSSSDSEVDSCSKSCITAYATLKEQYDSLFFDYRKSQFNLVSYKAGLELVETKLAHYKKNEAVFEESINVLKLEVKLKDTALVENKKNLEKAEKERDELKLTLEKFQNSSKSLNNLLESQVIDKFKTGLGYNAASSTATSPAVESFVNSSEMLENQEYNKSKSNKGYHAVPPPFIGNFIPRKPDLTFMDEIVEIEPKTVRKSSFRPPVIEDWNSDDESEVEIIPRDKTVSSSTEKIKFVKTYRETVKKVIRQVWNNSRRVNHNNFANKMTHSHLNRRFVPQAVLTKSGKIKTAGASVNTAVRPVNTAGSKPTVNHPRPISNAYKRDIHKVKDTTARDRAVESENKGKGVNVVKASTCWVWKAKNGSASNTFKKYSYIYARGRSKSIMAYYDGGFISFGDGKGRIYGKGKIKTGTLDFDNKGKQHKASYKAKLVNSISKPLHMLHMDLFGPTNVKSLMKKSYCLVVTDDFSRFSWVFFLATKDETSGILKTFITEIENQLDYKVKVIRCDNGTEFKNSVMNQFCEMKGIKREFSVARTPQQNGVAERRNRTLIEAARTMLVDSKLPTTFWAKAVNTACYVLNRVLVIKPHNKTPYELIHGRTPLIDFMKPFGCPVTILNTRDHLGKFDGKADEGFFVGKLDRLLFDVGQAVDETELNKIHLIPICTTDSINSQDPSSVEEDAEEKPTEMDEIGASNKDGKMIKPQEWFERLLQQEKQTVHPNSTNSINTISTPVSAAGPSFTIDDPSSLVNAAEASNAFEEHLFERFSSFKNAFTLPPVSNVTPMDDSRFLVNVMMLKIVVCRQADLKQLGNNHELIQDLEDPSWIEVMQEELLQFQLQIVWTLVNLPNGKRAIETKWVFRNKKDKRGIVVINMARLVTQGYIQEEGLDFDMDVKSAFLYSTIDEEVYVCQPPSFEDLQFLDKVPVPLLLAAGALAFGCRCPSSIAPAEPGYTKTVTTSNELELLFSLMFDELLNGLTQVVSKSSVVNAADDPDKPPDKRQQQNITQSTSTTVAVDIPPLNIQTTPETNF